MKHIVGVLTCLIFGAYPAESFRRPLFRRLESVSSPTRASIALRGGGVHETFALSSTAVLKLVASAGLGYGAAAHGTLDPPTVKALSKLVYVIFQPALVSHASLIIFRYAHRFVTLSSQLFANVAMTLSSPGTQQLNFGLIPIFGLCQIVLGSTIGEVYDIS